jgi:hypothetical protein
VQVALEATRVVQKHQAALNLANQSLHAAFDGWSAIETNPATSYLNAKSLEANSCKLSSCDKGSTPHLHRLYEAP